MQQPQTYDSSARAAAHLAGAGVHLLASAAEAAYRGVRTVLARAGIVQPWSTGRFYGCQYVADVGRSSAIIYDMRARLAAIQPILGVEIMVPQRSGFESAADRAGQALAIEADSKQPMREIAVTDKRRGPPGGQFLVVVFRPAASLHPNDLEGETEPELGLKEAGSACVLSSHADFSAAQRSFRKVARKLGSEHLGNVEGSPWAKPTEQRGILARWAIRFVKLALLLLVVSWVAKVAGSGPHVAAASAAGVSGAAAAGAHSAQVDAEAARVLQSVAANAEAAASAGGSAEDIAAHAWDHLTPEQQKVLLNVAAGVAAPGANTAAMARDATPTSDAAAAPADAHERVLSDSEMAAVLKEASIGLHPGKKGMPAAIVFEDPLCPSCRDFAATQIPADIPVAAVPIAFQTGADVWASKALCSPEPEKAWGALMGGVPPAAKATCVAGDSTIARNNELFRSLSFTATPTLVAPNGHVMVGAPDAATFAAWYQANLK